jgi:hypothetical protein
VFVADVYKFENDITPVINSHNTQY